MRLDGRFALEGISLDEAWLALSDPHVQETTLPGCRAVAERNGTDSIDFDTIRPLADGSPVLAGTDPAAVRDRALTEGDRYATRVEVGIGPATHRFDAVVEIVERAFPVMRATGRGLDDDGAFAVEAGMELSERSDAVDVAWWLSADVGDRVGRVGAALLDPVADRFVARYVTNLSTEFDARETPLRP